MTFRAVLTACCLAVAVDATSLHLRSLAALKAKETGELMGENRAASTFFGKLLNVLPKNMTKAKEEAVVKTLEAEVGKLEENVKTMKSIQKNETAHKHDGDDLKNHMKGADKVMLEKMDEWSARSNEKAKVGAMSVMSKLKNAIHLIKKGALSGNQDANNRLNDVLKQMTNMAR